MLRASAAAFQRTVDIGGLADAARDPGLEGGRALLAYVDATLDRDDDPGPARAAVAEALGDAGVVRAAAVIGNFEMMNRLADGIGVPVGPKTRSTERDLIETLGLDRIEH